VCSLKQRSSSPAFLGSSIKYLGEVGEKKVWPRFGIWILNIELFNCKDQRYEQMADRPEKEKKRKREKDGSSQPNKRVAVEADEQIEISLLDSDKWAPVIGRQRPKSPSFTKTDQSQLRLLVSRFLPRFLWIPISGSEEMAPHVPGGTARLLLKRFYCTPQSI